MNNAECYDLCRICQVTNPLSVKTKVHIARSPSALLSLKERENVFLEVHIENLTQGSMWFEYMRFECVDNWTVEDVGNKSLSSGGAMTLLQPQDVRQYIYILTPTTPSSFPVQQIPGATVPLGRLDISWRSLFGEPGHLLTSVRCIYCYGSSSLTQDPPDAVSTDPSIIIAKSAACFGAPVAPAAPTFSPTAHFKTQYAAS
jgi:hypothetical protein